MKRFSAREALLMLAPVAVLGAFGWLLSARKPAVIAPVGPFRPYVYRVQVLPALARDVFDGYDTRVVVEFSAHGRVPVWWNAGSIYHAFENTAQIVTVQAGKTVLLKKALLNSPPDFDSISKRWVSTYNLKLQDIPAQPGQMRLRDAVHFTGNSGKVLHKFWLDVPIRAGGVTTTSPLVSRVPCAILEDFSLDPTPPVDSNKDTSSYRSTMFRVHLNLLKNIPRIGAEKDTANITTNLAIVDGRGKRVDSIWGQQQWERGGIHYQNSFAQTADPQRFGFPKASADPRRYLVGGDSSDFSLIKPSGPLYLRGAVYCGDKWPLAINIPLRDANGKMLFTPRTSPVPFRVLSVAQVAPTTPETNSSGADSAVSVKLQALDPKADVSKWVWEIDYSQRIHNSYVGIVWPSGRNPITPSIEWNATHSVAELRYPLMLNSIGIIVGKSVFRADIAANRCRRIPIEVTVLPYRYKF